MPSPRPWILAHRGLHEQERENTLAAFEAAAQAGADGIEFDVRATRDGSLVLHHDERLHSRGRPALREVPAVQLPTWIPTLDDVLAWASPRPGFLLNVELKEAGHERETIAALTRARPTGRVALTSFLPEVLGNLRDEGARWPTGLLVDADLEGAAAAAKDTGAAFLVPRRRALTSELASEARARGLRLWVWDVKGPSDVARLPAFDYEAFITDYPRRFRGPGARASQDRTARKTSG